MTEFNNNNKYIPKALETYTVSYLETNQEVKKSPLSPAARSKVIRKWGGGYVSQQATTDIGEAVYGPCFASGCPYRNANFADFDIRISIEGNSRNWARRPGEGTFLPGSWTWSPTKSYRYTEELWLTNIDQAQQSTHLLVNDDLYVVNLVGLHCVEDNKFCNCALSIIRKAVNYHERGGEVRVNETIDSNVSKWSRWGFKAGAAIGASFINPAAGVAIGTGIWMTGTGARELCDSDRGKAFWDAVSGMGISSLGSGAMRGIDGFLAKTY